MWWPHKTHLHCLCTASLSPSVSFFLSSFSLSLPAVLRGTFTSQNCLVLISSLCWQHGLYRQGRLSACGGGSTFDSRCGWTRAVNISFVCEIKNGKRPECLAVLLPYVRKSDHVMNPTLLFSFNPHTHRATLSSVCACIFISILLNMS